MLFAIEKGQADFFALFDFLFVEKRHSSSLALIPYASYPVLVHGAGIGATLGANNHPVDALIDIPILTIPFATSLAIASWTQV